jgi:hypothetical protein
MIPTIEQIIEDLIAGTISKSQAVIWLNQHAEGAVNELRDYFAAKAMQGIISKYGNDSVRFETTAENSYRLADEMLKARES